MLPSFGSMSTHALMRFSTALGTCTIISLPPSSSSPEPLPFSSRLRFFQTAARNWLVSAFIAAPGAAMPCAMHAVGCSSARTHGQLVRKRSSDAQGFEVSRA